MSLTDKEILELTELCNAVIEATLTEQQNARLAEYLGRSVEARQFYVRFTGLSASLYYHAGEMQTEARDAETPPLKRAGTWKWVFGACALAASVMLAVWLYPRTSTPSAERISDEEFVARLTASKDCVWGGSGASVQLGSRMGKGARVQLAKGYAEITFDCGAKVVLEGPASLDLNSPWTATLNSGKLKAKLPPEAMGFTVVNSTVKVMDLGTEFAMIADPAGGGTEVLVLQGRVEAAPSAGGDQQSILLSTNESRRFAATGNSPVENSEEKFSDLTQPVTMDRFVPPVGYAHWSFDEPTGFSFAAEEVGVSRATEFHLENGVEMPGATPHVKGKWERSLRFDGHLFGRATVTGISDNSPHTVAFWVNVAKDASLANAYAMVAWEAQRPILGTHPIHIGWNRNADEGVIGVLRTDYGGGYALGATPIRDGQWHHVAVVFMPRDDAESPMEVKQYLDGRLEGEGVKSPPGSDVFRATDRNGNGMNDTLWIGTRVGLKTVRADRFVGRMDELFVMDRALEPQEIVALMANNRL